MGELSEKDLEGALEYDTSFKMVVDNSLVVAGEIKESVITDAHDTYIKLLAYAGPPPTEWVTRGITSFSAYVPWVRVVATGIRTLFPGIGQKEVYEKTMHYADWCRQQRRKA